MRADEPILRCPICGGALMPDGGGRSMRCPAGHSFDIAREGYINLLMSNADSSRRHGDDRLMLNARRSFLEKGYYTPLVEEIFRMLEPHIPNGGVMLDCGCGDGWYTQRLGDMLSASGILPELIGVDISRDAVKMAAKRCRDMTAIVASAYKLPVAHHCADALLSVFAPVAPDEFARVLKRNGVLVTAVPLERHLFGLKAAVYDSPYENPHDSGTIDGFTLSERRRIAYTITLDGETARELFMMTPYYYKTSRSDQQKLDNIGSLTTETEFEVRLYRPI